MRICRGVTGVGVLALVGCGVPPPPVPESVVTSGIVNAVVEHAGPPGGGRYTLYDGPLLVDLASFSRVDSVHLAGVAARPRLTLLGSSKAHAVRCRWFGRGCRIRDDGLYLHLDSLAVAGPDAFTATVTYGWTDERHSGITWLGFATLHLEFRNTRGEWRLLEWRVIEIT